MQRLKNRTRRNRSVSSKYMRYMFPKTTQQFNIIFVHDDHERSVEVIESEFIDFNQVIEQLKQGNSVFIAPRSYGTINPTRNCHQKRENSDFFSHI